MPPTCKPYKHLVNSFRLSQIAIYSENDNTILASPISQDIVESFAATDQESIILDISLAISISWQEIWTKNKALIISRNLLIPQDDLQTVSKNNEQICKKDC